MEQQNVSTDPNLRPGPIDKSRVLDVKPLRRLVPVFPGASGMSSVSAPQPTPFVCVSPTGPFPPGVQPFYPFVAPNSANQATHGPQHQPVNFGFENSIPAPVPLNSYRTPTPAKKRAGKKKKKASEVAVEDDGYESLSQVGEFDDKEGASATTKSGKRRARKDGNDGDNDGDSLVNNYLALFKLKELDDFRRSKGDRDTVAAVLLVFNLIRRKMTQIEEAKDASGAVKRPDLKASNLMMKSGARTNMAKRIGHVPGLEIGDIFFFRMEMCLVGLHAQSMGGIDYMGVKVTADEEPLAVSIVSAGGYDDDGNDSNVIIYSGQGGLKDGKVFDQKLERGNLALEKSVKRGNEIRVLRGVKDPAAPTGKIYIYDGLYRIQESWVEKGKTGCNVFKYKIIRIPGQQEAFSLWKTIQQWRDGSVTRPGIILPDLTSGGEALPVTLVNNVDGMRGPAHFTYVRSLVYHQQPPFSTSSPSPPCHCLGGCQPGDTACPCVRRNDGLLPYSSLGVLLTDRPLAYECGAFCGCPLTCRNRVTQAGVKLRLEVFKTENRGWGLRSWDPIRSGSFICEYAGDVIKGSDPRYEGDEFIFDTTRKYPSLGPDDSNSYEKTPYPLVISSKHSGNAARFMNHSCSPNVHWMPVVRESNNDVYLHVAFFALRHIPPLQELTFDYGVDARERGRRKCFCGAAKCRGYFYG